MAFLTTLPGLALITKFYSAYALSLAFILQSSLTLLLALVACVVHVQLRRRMRQRQLVVLFDRDADSAAKACSQNSPVADVDRGSDA